LLPSLGMEACHRMRDFLTGGSDTHPYPGALQCLVTSIQCCVCD
jgi:hypothetical protein